MNGYHPKFRRILLQAECILAGVMQGTQFNVDQMQMTSDGVSQCTASVECAPAWAEEASGVVDIYAIDMRLGAMGLCTGIYFGKF